MVVVSVALAINNSKYILRKKIHLAKNIFVLSSNTVVVPSEYAGDGFGQVQSIFSHKVRKDASHLPKPNLAQRQNFKPL